MLDHVLRQADRGDVIVYLDAGCRLHNPEDMWSNWVLLLLTKELEMLAVGIPYEERMYSKGDAFKYFNVSVDGPIGTSHQLMAGLLFFRVTRRTQELVRR